MPSPEFRFAPDGADSRPDSKEREPVPYYRVAAFDQEARSQRAYFAAQETVFQSRGQVDLSTYRIQLDQVSHVVVLGEPPPAEIDQRLQQILAAGEPATLPADVLTLLAERRAQATHQGPWIERHHRPGKLL